MTEDYIQKHAMNNHQTMCDSEEKCVCKEGVRFIMHVTSLMSTSLITEDLSYSFRSWSSPLGLGLVIIPINHRKVCQKQVSDSTEGIDISLTYFWIDATNLGLCLNSEYEPQTKISDSHLSYHRARINELQNLFKSYLYISQKMDYVVTLLGFLNNTFLGLFAWQASSRFRASSSLLLCYTSQDSKEIYYSVSDYFTNASMKYHHSKF